MDQQYYIELTIDDNGETRIFKIFEDKALVLDQAKAAAGQFYMGGYVWKESEVALVSDYTLFPPTQIKKIRLVAKKISLLA
jgi:hypothetical protein